MTNEDALTLLNAARKALEYVQECIEWQAEDDWDVLHKLPDPEQVNDLRAILDRIDGTATE